MSNGSSVSTTAFGAALLLLVPLVALSGAGQPADGLTGIVGSWRLDAWTVADGAPRCTQEEGGASGQIVYSADGHMSAQLGCAGLSVGDLASLRAQDAVARMTRRHFSYYGTYTLDEAARSVTHHVMGSSAESWVGRNLVRGVAFEGPDRLVLTPAEGGGRLVWLRN